MSDAPNAKKAALAYAKRGFEVIAVWPLHNGRCTCPKGAKCPAPGKHPMHAEWTKKATRDPARVAALFDKYPHAHVGILPPEGHVIIDVDPRHDGDKTLKQLMNGHAMPATPTQRSGGGGWHYVFEGEINGSLGKGIDIRRPHRGMVVAWPSMHISGKRYRWEVNPNTPPAPLPAALRGKPVQPPQQPSTAPAPVPLDTITEALSHIDADDYARWVNIGQALRNAYGDERGRELWEAWSKTSSKWRDSDADKWDSFDLNRDRPLITVRSIMALARRSGYRPLAKEFENGLWAQGDLSTLLDTPPPPIEWVFEPCIPAGKVTLLAGAGGASKSYLALTLAMQLAIGQEFGPFKPGSKTGKAMLLVAEENRDDIHRRLHAVCNARMYTKQQRAAVAKQLGVVSVRGLDWRLMEHDQGGNLDETARVDYLIEELQALGDVRLLVFDPLVAFNGAAENDNAEMARLMFTLDRIADRIGCAVMVVHHVSKGGQVMSLNEATQSVVRGASALVDNARSALLVMRMPRIDAPLYNLPAEQAGRYVVLRVVKNNYGPHISDVMLAVENEGALRLAPEVIRVHTTMAQATRAATEHELLPRMLAAMLRAPEATQRDLSSMLGVSQPRVAQLFTQALREGYLHRSGVGRATAYALTPAGRGVAGVPDEPDVGDTKKAVVTDDFTDFL